MKKELSLSCIALALIAATGCSQQTVADENQATQSTSSAVEVSEQVAKPVISFKNKNYIRYVDVSDINKDRSKLEAQYRPYYVKSLHYKAPNGKFIKLFAADKVSDEQLLKAYNVLSFYLTDHGDYKKARIANAMANNGAVLVLPNGADGDGQTPSKAIMSGQPLYQKELPVAGGVWYQKNDYSHRDAAYEEIFHMVHDYGIGTTQNPRVEKKLAERIKEGMEIALPKNKSDWGLKGLWGLGSREWLLSLEPEGSLEQEYIVGGLDSYFGLWEAYTESDRGMWGMYIPKNRQGVKEKDPISYEVITAFLGPYLTYMERIAPEFEGTFKMSLDKALPYTFKSQYLQNARLTGHKNTHLEGNALDNILLGNAGNNTLDGKEGTDVVQFSGASSEYTIKKDKNTVVVKDQKNRDGKDILKNIDILRFTDQDVRVDQLP
ncbi:MAG: hypothetical protein KGV48_003040 [Alcaligenaceae bacterium]|nr:hypothetical protein [Alcaligenaceae bacterium]